MRNKGTKWILVTVVVVVAGFIFWYYFTGIYRPKAYMVISDVQYGEGNMRHRIHSINTFGMEVDLHSADIDTFPIDVRVPSAFTVNPTGKFLYITGREGTAGEVDEKNQPKWSRENPPKMHDIQVYDLKGKRLAKSIGLPDDANGRVGTLTLSPDGNRLFLSNPYKDEENAPIEEQKGKNWIINLKTGEFLFSFDVGYGPYMKDDGSKSYMFSGPKDSEILEPGFTAYDIDNDTVITAYRDYDRLMEEQGGLHIEEFKFGYPHMEGNRPLKFYDRDTYEKIEQIDLTRDFGSDDQLGISLPLKDMITRNKNYLVVKITKEIKGRERSEYYLRLVDIQNMEIKGTIKVWEGSGRVLGPVAH